MSTKLQLLEQSVITNRNPLTLLIDQSPNQSLFILVGQALIENGSSNSNYTSLQF